MQLWNHFATSTASILEDLASLADEGFDLISMLRDCRRRHPDASWRLLAGFHDGHDDWPTERDASRKGTGARVLIELVGVSGPRPLAHGFSVGDSPTDEARRATLRAIGHALDMKANHDLQQAQQLRPGECEVDFIDVDERCF